MKELSDFALADIEEAFLGKIWVFAPVVGSNVCHLGVAVANEPGYTPISPTLAHAHKYDDISDHVDRLNRRRGFSDEIAMRIVASTMRKKGSVA